MWTSYITGVAFSCQTPFFSLYSRRSPPSERFDQASQHCTWTQVWLRSCPLYTGLVFTLLFPEERRWDAMNLWKFLFFLFSFSKEIGRLGVWARLTEQKILSTCAQKSSFKRFRQKHPLIFIYSYGLLWHYSYEQVYTLLYRWFGVDWGYPVQSA